MAELPLILTTNLGVDRVTAKLVLRFITLEQKQHQVEIFKSDRTFLPRLITEDETYDHGYETETKHESSKWKRPS